MSFLSKSSDPRAYERRTEVAAMSTLARFGAMPVAAPGSGRGCLHSAFPARSVRRITLRAPAQPESVGQLRKRVSVILSGWLLGTDETQAAELVVSELLTNAVEHGHDEMTLGVTLSGSALEITVTDHGPATESGSSSDPDEHGRGLAIVAAIAQDLSIDKTPGGWRAVAGMAIQPAMSDRAA
ncbi:ATP-binding protein [Streptomyces sp. NPDC018026]|uniref:ATP-binding protein n=1 Tax=Streptomyces sp. NPDC018026 TaxID=3365031 RepID=UPI00379CA31C